MRKKDGIGMISVIVPVYNTKEYLPRCMKSLISQEYEEKEIILVNDGSTDGSEDLCDAYSRKYAYVKVFHKENGGLMSAWIAGVKISRGEYLCFVDSDDWVEAKMIEEMAKFLSESDKEIVACNHSIDRENGEREFQNNGLAPGIYDRKMLERRVFPEILGNEVRKICFSRCMKLISRELIEQNLLFCNQKIKMGEDVNIMLPALLDAERIVILEKSYYYHYYYNRSSTVHKYDTGLYDNVKLLYQTIKQIISEKFQNNKASLREMLQRADMEYIFLLMLVIKNEVRGNGSGCYKNIKAVCRETEYLMQNTPVKVSDKANRLLYMVMKHPNTLMISLLRLAMVIYYR